MTSRLSILSAAVFAVFLLGQTALPATARSDQASLRSETTDWSAVKKRYRYVRPHYYGPVYAAPRAYGRLGDPSLGPNGLPYQRPYDPGGCIIDEGYGRFTSCSNR